MNSTRMSRLFNTFRCVIARSEWFDVAKRKPREDGEQQLGRTGFNVAISAAASTSASTLTIILRIATT